MFEVGDKLVCISCNETSMIKIGMIYTIKEVGIEFTNSIRFEEIPNLWYDKYIFISLLEYRRNKILKLKERINESR